MSQRILITLCLILILAMSACASASETTVSAEKTETPKPIYNPTTVECPNKIENITLEGSNWEEWDGAPRSYETSVGSVFTISHKSGELIIHLLPMEISEFDEAIVNITMPRSTQIILPFVTTLDDSAVFVGPIFIRINKHGEVSIDETYAKCEIEVTPETAPELPPTLNPEDLQG